MMRYQILILILLSPLLARSEEFTRPNKTQKATPQARAVFHLKMQDSFSCSGILIGPGGEALTNLHCLEKCLKDGARVNVTLITSKVNKFEVSLNDPQTCSVEISNGKKAKPQDIQILHIFGPGFLGPREALPEFALADPAQFTDLLNQGFEGSSDLALIRIGTQDLEAPACIRLNEDPNWLSQDRREVYGFSYPVVMRFKASSNPISSDTFMTLGGTLLRSQGEATSNLSLLKEDLSESALEFIDTWLAPGTFLTSLDAEGGASGSAVYNTEGKLVGVVRSTFKGDVADYVPWMSGAIDLGPKRAEILSLVPNNSSCL